MREEVKNFFWANICSSTSRLEHCLVGRVMGGNQRDYEIYRI